MLAHAVDVAADESGQEDSASSGVVGASVDIELHVGLLRGLAHEECQVSRICTVAVDISKGSGP